MDSLDEFISSWMDYAQNTAKLLGLDVGIPKDILEIGCGMGHLSIVLKQLGHNVISCDDKNWINNFKISNPTSMYLQACKKIDHDFSHFHFTVPHQKNKKVNHQMFDQLKSYHHSKYDFILWQNSCFWQKHNNIDIDDTKTLIQFLQSLLTKDGKLIFGYSQHNYLDPDPDFESSKSYQWLSPWRTKRYQDKMGYYTFIMGPA